MRLNYYLWLALYCILLKNPSSCTTCESKSSSTGSGATYKINNIYINQSYYLRSFKYLKDLNTIFQSTIFVHHISQYWRGRCILYKLYRFFLLQFLSCSVWTAQKICLDIIFNVHSSLHWNNFFLSGLSGTNSLQKKNIYG